MRKQTRRLGAAAIAAALLATLALAATALASKEVVDVFGESGSEGGQFSVSRDVAVNSTGAGPADAGDVYVVEERNDRVQRFDAEGDFVSAWGADVHGINERQGLEISATAGTFTLEFEGETTEPIGWDARPDNVASALEALPAIGEGNVRGSFPNLMVIFKGALGGTDVPELVPDSGGLSGGVAKTTVTTLQDGAGGPGEGYEVCTEALLCKAGIATGGNGEDASQNGALDSPQAIAVDGDTGDVYVSDRDNRRINVYDGAGGFIRSFGWDVVESGPGETGAEYEICEQVDGDVCKAGLGSGEPGAGQFHSSNPFRSSYGIALSPPDGEAATGTLFLANSGARRVETFDLDGANPASFGSEATFGEDQPRHVAVDSRGIAYASNSEEGGRIERYDTENANGEGVGFLEPISATIAGTDEVQELTFSGFSAASTFTLSCPNGDVTDPIEYGQMHNPRAQRIVSALEAECGPSFVVTTTGAGGGINNIHLVVFEGDHAVTDVPTTVCTTVSGPGSCSVTEEVDGVPTVPGALLAGNSAFATAGLEVDPDSDGGGPDTDVLHVLREADPGDDPTLPEETLVQQFGPAEEPGLAVAPSEDDDRHGEGAGFGFNPGLGLDGESGRLFVNWFDTVYVLDEIPAPEASIDPASEIGARSATFSGAVDPKGAPTGYRFEYVTDAQYQADGFASAARVPIADADAGNGAGAVAVEHGTPHTLVPSTLYHVRLIAGRTFSTAEAIAGPVTFTTDPAAPTIAGAEATVGTDSATLRAAIDPENQEVSEYRFEWGADASYGNTTPAGELPQGTEPVAVSAELTGLTPGQTYHYRLLATNATGTTTGPDRALTTYLHLPGLGPERAYELASHYPTEGTPILTAGRSGVGASEDGDRALVSTLAPLPGTAEPPPRSNLHGNNGGWRHRFDRTPDGWERHDYNLKSSGIRARGGPSTDLFSYAFGAVDEPPDPRLDPDDQNDDDDAYLRRADGSIVWLSRDPRVPPGTPQTAPGRAGSPIAPMLAMSVDGRTAVFGSERALDDADTTPNTQFRRLYKWTEGKGARFIGARPDGSAPVQGSELPASLPYVVSRDGSRVVFDARRTDDGSQTIYVQTDGAPTVEAVKETGVPPLPEGEPSDVTYRGSAADLSRVFYTTSSRLAPEAGATFVSNQQHDDDLYLYDLAADEVRDLTPRTDGIADPEVDPAESDRARVRGVAASSEDGRRVYFVADARYPTAPNPRGELPSPAGRNLYLAELGEGIGDPVELRFVAALGAGDEDVWRGDLLSGDGKAAYASPDGAVLGFGSGEPLTGQGLGGTNQLFVYDAEAGTLGCASCPPDGSLPVGDVNIYTGLEGDYGQVWQGIESITRWVSSGGTVFFHARSRLVGADENSVDDVYEYRAGELRLIGSGANTRNAKFGSASRDGSTVLFNTLEALAPKDEEPGVPKLYAARVGGGFPFTPEAAPCDLGAGACEGAGTSAPARPGAGTAAFRGPGNAAIAAQGSCARRARSARRLSRRAKRSRRAARRARNPRRARRLSRRARRSARAARKRSRATKRCRRAARRASASGRAGR